MDSMQLTRLKKEMQPKENFSTSLYTPDNSEMNMGEWPRLSGTGEEVKNIKKLFDINRIPSRLYTGLAASEENLKYMGDRSPPVLFVATHGIFLREKNNKNTAAIPGRNAFVMVVNPLLRSG